MAFEFNRNQQDQNYTSTVTVLSGGANTAAFDLEQVIGGDIEAVVFELAAPACNITQLTDGKVLTYALQDSADGTTFAAVDPAISTTQTSATANSGVAAKTVRFRLPANTRRYVRIAQTATATPGTLGVSMVAKLLF
jgi:hypothetical protein